MLQPHVDPNTVVALGPWALIRQDAPPKESSGGIIIPGNAKLGGQRVMKATVLSCGSGRGREANYEHLSDGARILVAAIAQLPTTSQSTQQMFDMGEKDGSKVYFIHLIDVLLTFEGDGPEPEVV